MDAQLSMDQAFISTLDEIMENNYHIEKFGIKELAEAAGVSRSKLHRKLKKLKQQSASEYMRYFRLEKAFYLLENKVSSVSEIAYAVGFSSPSYFSKCFFDRYHCTPVEVKNKEATKNDALPSTKQPAKHKGSSFKIAAVILMVILTLISLSAVINKLQGLNQKQEVITLGVLPFKNLSNDPENQYFADGILEVILNHLSDAENLRVVSRTTMDQFQATTKTIPEISKELELTHVMEASVQKYGDKIRIVVQLINAHEDKHIWAERYDRDFEDVFNLQAEIAKEVASQLEKKLSDTTLKSIQKTPTSNIEAYNLYLKGRFFWQRRSKEDLEKSIQYFEQALELDPQFSIAYAGLADAYYITATWGWYDKDDGYKKSKDYAIKSLSYDNETHYAYATLGGISLWYDWNWKEAESYLKKALEFAPDYANAHLYYAILLDILGRKKEAREQIDLALKINPNSVINYYISNVIYYHNQQYDQALEHLKKSVEIKGNPWHAYFLRNYLHLGKNELALEQLKAILQPSSIDLRQVDSLYLKSGIKNTIGRYLDSLSFDIRENYYNRAVFACLTEQPDKALDFLEKSYESRETIIIRMKENNDFAIIRSRPRFIALLEKVNLNSKS